MPANPTKRQCLAPYLFLTPFFALFLLFNLYPLIKSLVLAFHVTNGPTEAGTVAELYGDRPLPVILVELLRTAQWCDQAGSYVPIGDPARLRLTPRP